MRTSAVRSWWAVCLLCLAAAGGSAAGAGVGAGAGVITAMGLPLRLSQTGLYSDARRLAVDERNRAYAPQYPLWTDGATKRRWFRLPHGQTIDASRMEA